MRGRTLWSCTTVLLLTSGALATVAVVQWVRSFGMSLPGVASTVAGPSWRGRMGDGWDFTLTAPRPGDAADTTVFTYQATSLAGEGTQRGSFAIVEHRGRLLGQVTGGDGAFLRGFDGMVTPDRRLAFGTAWLDRATGPASAELIRWWATIEVAAPAAPEPLDLNRATVGELEAAGLSPRAARTIVQGSLWAPYAAVAEALAAPDLNEREQAVLRGGVVGD